MNDRYYVGEYVFIKVIYGNFLVVYMNIVIWKKEIDIGIYIIDIKLLRLSVLRDILEIRFCCELDVGIYFVLVDCRNNFGIKSNIIYLKVVEGNILYVLCKINICI